MSSAVERNRLPRHLGAAILWLLPLFAAAAIVLPDNDAELTTEAERSGFARTGRYDEVEQLCRAYARRWPQAVRCFDFGSTAEGRPMKALVASTVGVLDPGSARSRGLEAVVIQGGIHAGEIDGKDGGFSALRELLESKDATNPLQKVVVVFVPVFNVDGHERFRRWNRPNQNGPEEMGWRATAQNLNLNRDYIVADAPEMRAMLGMLQAWDPILYVDLHTTDGARYEYDSSLLVEPIHTGDSRLFPAGRQLRAELYERLVERGHLPLKFYPSLTDSNDPASGFEESVFPARVSLPYRALCNRYAIIVETNSWKPYSHRVLVMHNAVLELARMAASHATEWRRLAQSADADATRIAGTTVPLDLAATGPVTTIEFRGYRYTRETSPVSGTLALRYDESEPMVWQVPFRGGVAATSYATAPVGGYIVPAAHATWLADRLEIHGIDFVRLDRAVPGAAVDAFRATSVTFAAQSSEGRVPLTLEGSWAPERMDVPGGSLFVPIAQPKARLVMTLLEPASSDSYVRWGFFNAAFEAKEHVEDYVAEQLAAEMLEQDASFAAEFAHRLATDAAFAASPADRLGFFKQRHSTADERMNLYPVLRVGAWAVERPFIR